MVGGGSGPSSPVRNALTVYLLSVFLTGCGSLVGTPSPGSPSTPPGSGAGRPSQVSDRIPVQAPTVEAGVHDRQAESISSEPIRVDPILDSPWAQQEDMEVRVQRWIESFQGREAPLLEATLARMGRHEEMVSEELKAAGLPGSLLFLPIVESWYKPTALSPVGASGLWQFMPPTARGMGLKVDRLIDERRDPYLATPLALAYLASLREQFDSWFLALAAYNSGPGRIQRILRRSGQEGEGHDGLFLEILDQLPRETRNFVPRFLAASRIGMDPQAYGFGNVTPLGAWQFDEVVIPDATSLDVVARASGVPQEELEELNPQLLRGMTPAGVHTTVRVPLGTGVTFTEAYALIPPEERVTFLEHLVGQGETLTHIARQYGVSVDDLRATNPTIQPRRMQIGQRVVVPKAPSVRSRLGSRPASSPAEAQDRLVVYRVQSGDTLGGIAVRHRVGVGDLLRWNSLSRTTLIHPGDEVRIYLPGG